MKIKFDGTLEEFKILFHGLQSLPAETPSQVVAVEKPNPGWVKSPSVQALEQFYPLVEACSGLEGPSGSLNTALLFSELGQSPHAHYLVERAHHLGSLQALVQKALPPDATEKTVEVVASRVAVAARAGFPELANTYVSSRSDS